MMLAIMWAMTAAILGFMAGRVSMYGLTAQEEGTENDKESSAAEKKSRERHGRGRRVQENEKTWSVGSPVSGRVTIQRDGDHPSIMIDPDTDKIYAPAGGKIIRLFPMGNAFLFKTEFGAELYIQAGDGSDELLGRYYRPRILQNEVVGKGKLLLEFDRQGLESEGAPLGVSVSLENCLYGSDIRLTAGEHVGNGEEIIQVGEPMGLGACPNYQ